MPFQSEKQRRYLWANEPEIARDWTDTYGSRIQKNNGGLLSIRQPYGAGGEIIKQLLLNWGTGKAKEKAEEYGYLPDSTQKKGIGSFLGRMLATMFLGPMAGLAWDAGSAYMNRKGSSFAPNFSIPNFSRPTTAQQQATQRFMQNYNVGRNPQTGRMVGGPFAGRNLPGTSMFGSTTPKEMAQKWVDKYGDKQYTTPKQKQKQQQIINIATMNQGPPGRGGNGGGGGGFSGAGAGTGASGPPGRNYNRGGLAALWPR